MLTFLRNLWHAQDTARAIGVYTKTANYWHERYVAKSKAFIARGNDHTKQIEALRLRHAAELAAHGRPMRGKGGRFEANSIPAPNRRPGGETLESIMAWKQDVFGEQAIVTPKRLAERALEEAAELREAINNGEREDRILEEAADVFLVLCNRKVWEKAIAKMVINRARKWHPRGDGTSYHIKEPVGSALPVHLITPPATDPAGTP